jgi:hypothetical protein
MIHIVETIFFEEAPYQCVVLDGSGDKSRSLRHLISKPSGQVVQNHNFVPHFQAKPGYVTADETCTARNQ